MARKPRLHVPGGFYHASQRAQPSAQLFLAKEDGNRFYQLLAESQARFNCKIHGFCLTADQINLLVQIDQIPLTKIMHNLNYRYTRYLQNKHNIKGAIFYDRHRAQLFDENYYLAPLLNYMHALPVTNNIVDTPLQYLWSSARAYSGKEKFAWLQTSPGLTQIKSQPFRVRLTDKLIYQSILGDQNFQTKVQMLAQKKSYNIQLPLLVDEVCKQCQVTHEELIASGKNHKRSLARGILAVLSRDLPSVSLTDVSHLVARDLTTLSALAHRIEKRAKNDNALALIIKNIKAQFI